MNGVDFPEPRRQTVLEAAEAPENDPAVSQAGVSRKTMDSTDVQSGPTQTKGMAEMCERKYELTDETKTLSDGTVLHRIRAVRDFGSKELTKIHTGDLGGWVDGEDRLSHEGNAWIYDDAQAYGDSKVLGDAHVFGNAKVYDHARVYGCATVGGTACVYGRSKVCGRSSVNGNAHVYGVAVVSGDAFIYGSVQIYKSAYINGNAIVRGSARVYGNVWVFGYAQIYGDAQIHDGAWVYGDAQIFGDAEIYGDARVYESAQVYNHAQVHGDVRICGAAIICGDAQIGKSSDYAVYKNTWSSDRWFTYTRSNRKWKVGCFLGTGEELIAKAFKDSERSGRCYEAIVRAQEAIERENTESDNGEKGEGSE